MKSGKYVSCIEDDDSGVHHVSRDNYAYLFYTSDEEKHDGWQKLLTT